MREKSKSEFIILSLLAFLLILLPWFEHDQRGIGYVLLLLGSGLIGLLFDWKRVKFDLLDCSFLLFLIFASISTIFSWSVGRSFMELARYLAYFIHFVSIRRFAENNLRNLKKIYIFSILIDSFLLSLISWLFTFSIPIIPHPSSGTNLYHATYGHNKLADLLIFAIPITYFMMLKLRIISNLKYKLSLGMLVFFVITFSATFSKSGYLVLIMIIGLIYYLSSKNNTIKTNLNKIQKMLVLLILPVFLIHIFIVANTYFFKICGKGEYSLYCKNLAFDWRWDYFAIAIKALRERPLIGIGLDNFRYLSKMWQSQPASWSDHGENYYFTLFSEVGIFGAGTLTFLILSTLYKTFQKLNSEKNMFPFGIFFALVGSAMHTFFTVDWYFLSIFMYFWVGLAILLPVGKN